MAYSANGYEFIDKSLSRVKYDLPFTTLLGVTYSQSAEGEDLVDAYGESPDLPYVSGFGVNQIFDLSPLSDNRWNKNAYVGNAFALPEYYDFPYISEIYFDTSNPYHWKIRDCHYRFYEEQAVGLTDISFAKLTYEDFGYGMLTVTDGTSYIESTVATGSWEYIINIDAATASNSVGLIGDNIDTDNGYLVRINSSRALLLRRGDAGSFTTILGTDDNYIENGVDYRIRVERSVSNEFTMYIKGGAFGTDYVLVDTTGGTGTNPIVDSTHTISNYLSLISDADDEIREFRVNDSYINFQDFTTTAGTFAIDGLRSADELLLYQKGYGLECTDNGVTYLANTEAYGVQEFGVCKVTGTTFKVNFINDITSLEENGYTIQFTSDNRVRLREATGGSSSTIMSTPVGYIEDDICYGIKVTRNSVVDEYVPGAVNTFAVYIKGGLFGTDYVLVDPTGGSGTNPIIDSTHTTSVYSLVDYDDGDVLEYYYINSIPVDTRNFTDTTAVSTVISSQVDPKLTEIQSYVNLLPPTYEYYNNEV